MMDDLPHILIGTAMPQPIVAIAVPEAVLETIGREGQPAFCAT